MEKTEQFNSILDKINNQGNHKQSIFQLEREFQPVLECYSNFTYEIKPDRLYRARLNEHEKSFENYRELWYPPAENVNEMGRCNDVGESLFYGTFRPETSVFELNFEVGDLITLLSCTNKDKYFKTTAISFSELISSDQTFKDLIKSNGYMHTGNGEEKTIDSVLHQEFAKPVSQEEYDHYKITTALSHLLLRDTEKEGLIFCSSAHEVSGVNFVLKPEVADWWLIPEYACELIITREIGNNDFECKITKTSRHIGAEGNFTWREPEGLISTTQQLNSLTFI